MSIDLAKEAKKCAKEGHIYENMGDRIVCVRCGHTKDTYGREPDGQALESDVHMLRMKYTEKYVDQL